MASASDLCSLAWGEQQGYVALAFRNTAVPKNEPGYWVDRTFKWPEQKPKIFDLLKQAREAKRDVYWAPAVFDAPSRSKTKVSSVHSLWADLDEINPESLPKHLKPTAAWESSPGRYQAIWSLETALAPKYQQELNQRLTYAIGADKGGWDLTQVLRTPGSPNFKYNPAPKVRMMWLNGHVLSPSKLLDDLPELQATKVKDSPLPDVRDVLRTLKTSARMKTLLKARHATVGQRSERLWELECLLAEAGLEAPSIAAVVRGTVWNKFSTRSDEIDRLLIEATKAIDHTGVVEPVEVEATSEVLVELEGEDEIHGPQSWDIFDKDHQAISWMVSEVWGEGEVGFISGLPKSYKSWLALDLAISVATGTRFLGAFQARKHNVLLIQEEDPKPVLQDRLSKIGAAKGLISAKVTGDTTFDLTYSLPDNLYVISNQGFSLTEEWLEELEVWIVEHEIKMVILDPLMMIAGGNFDEFKAFEFMEKVLKPLKRVRARTKAAIVIVHHHIKGSADAGAKSMYGSVALWAWEEAALHLQVTGVGKVTAERFSKHSLLAPVLVEIGDVGEIWNPQVVQGEAAISSLFDLLATMESGATVEELVKASGMTRAAVVNQLKALAEKQRVEKAGTSSHGPGRPKTIWKVTLA